MPQGRPPNLKLLNAFERANSDDSKTPIAICKKCRYKAAWHPTRLEAHIAKCEPSLGQNAITSSLTPTTLREGSEIFFSRHQGSFTVQFQQFSPELNEQVYKFLTKIVIMDNLPFNAFNRGKDLSKVFTMINPTIKLPGRKEIATKWLDKIYKDVSA
jgi:hypothetical protein